MDYMRDKHARTYLKQTEDGVPTACKVDGDAEFVSVDLRREMSEATDLLKALKTSSDVHEQMLGALTMAMRKIETQQQEFIEHVQKAVSFKGMFVRGCKLPIRLIRKIDEAGIVALKYPVKALTKVSGKYKSFTNRLANKLNATSIPKRVSVEESVFYDIFRQNTWGSEESHSGTGSNLDQTIVIRKELPHLIKKYNIKTFLDLPCGDFNWMRHVDLGVERYVGADIVKDIVKANAAKYGSAEREFKQINLLTSHLPPADLILCRDCLVHLSFEDVQRAIANLHRSGIKYLLATTYTNRDANREIQTGDWTPYNLQVMPFYFPEPIEIFNENCTVYYPDFNDKSIGLWRIQDIPQTLAFVDNRNAA